MQKTRVLGLDLGTSSLGWSILEWEGQDLSGLPSRIVDSGVRIFPEGVSKTKTGEESLSAQRRLKRHSRRQIDRRARRRRKLFNCLRFLGLLPTGSELNDLLKLQLPIQSADHRPKYFAALDKHLLQKCEYECSIDAKLWFYLDLDVSNSQSKQAQIDRKHRLALRLPYVLRARAAQSFLDPFDLGRAILQLGERRGYQSNRKSDADDDGETSALLQRQEKLLITLGQEKETLGAFLARQSPTEQRLRNVPTTRKMYKDEFQKIQSAQLANPKLKLNTDDWKKIQKIIFDQRPLKSQSHLRNKCSLDLQSHCCQKARLIAQEYKLRVAILNLRYRNTDGQEQTLTSDQSQACFDLVWRGQKLTETKFQKVLGLGKTSRWNYDKSDDKNFESLTVSKIVKALCANEADGVSKWSEFGTLQEEFVDEILSFEKQEPLKRFLVKKYDGVKIPKLTEEQSEALSKIHFEQGFVAYSAKGLRTLLPYLRKGQRIDQALKEGEKSPRDLHYPPKEVHKVTHLPSVEDFFGDLRNPVVTRALTQLRKVINAIVDRHGLPDMIRVELAREVKKSSKERMEILRANSAREKDRTTVSAKLIESLPKFQKEPPKRKDIERYLLWIECGRTCVYTGKPIALVQLFDHGIEVEHIVPFSRSMDDSFANKTICYTSENKTKGNKTPFEAYGSDETKWNDMLERIKNWPNSKAESLLRGYSWGSVEKMRRFREIKNPTIDSFLARQLIDTQYTSKLARRYVSCLFDLPQSVQISNGALTGTLRKITGLEGFLGTKEDGKKARDDHRHHVVDAVMVALATPARVQALAASIGQAKEKGERYWKNMQAQFAGAKDLIEDSLKETRISVENRCRVRGSLHKDTCFGVRQVHVPIEIKKTKKASALVAAQPQFEVKEIAVGRAKVDPKILEDKGAIQRYAEDVLDDSLKNHLQSQPQIVTQTNIEGTEFRHWIGPNGKAIKKTMQTAGKLESLLKFESKQNERLLGNDGNHHIEIWATPKGKWEGRVMNMMEAHRLKSQGKSVYKSLGKVGENFVMQLHKQDLIWCEKEDDRPEGVWVVDTLWSTGQMVVMRIHDARPLTAVKTAKQIWAPNATGLKNAKAKRIVLDDLGYIIEPKDKSAS